MSFAGQGVNSPGIADDRSSAQGPHPKVTSSEMESSQCATTQRIDLMGEQRFSYRSSKVKKDTVKEAAAPVEAMELTKGS